MSAGRPIRILWLGRLRDVEADIKEQYGDTVVITDESHIHIFQTIMDCLVQRHDLLYENMMHGSRLSHIRRLLTHALPIRVLFRIVGRRFLSLSYLLRVLNFNLVCRIGHVLVILFALFLVN